MLPLPGWPVLVLCETDAAGRVTWSDDMERARRTQAYEEGKPMTGVEKMLAITAVVSVVVVGVVVWALLFSLFR